MAESFVPTYPMLWHSCHLLATIWTNIIQALGTTTLSIIVWSFSVPICIWLIAVLAKWNNSGRGMLELRAAFRESLSSAITTAVVTMAAWMIIFTCFFVHAIYDDHAGLVSCNQKLKKTDNERLKAKDKEIDRLTKLPYEKAVGTEAQSSACWFTSSSEDTFMKPSLPAAKTVTQVVIHCYRKYNAPFEATIWFDSDLLQGSMTVPDLGGGILSREEVKGDKLVCTFVEPSLPAKMAIVAYVQSASAQPPRASKVSLREM